MPNDNSCDRLISTGELVEILRRPLQTVYRIARRPDFPRPVPLGPKKRMWRLAAIQAWMRGQPTDPTSTTTDPTPATPVVMAGDAGLQQSSPVPVDPTPDPAADPLVIALRFALAGDVPAVGRESFARTLLSDTSDEQRAARP